MTALIAGGASSRPPRSSGIPSLLLLVSVAILAFALGRLMYHYVVFQGTLILS
jgi:hypothetical protein